MTITELDRQFVINTYKRFPIEIVSGHGSLAYDRNGREYIDLTSGIGVTSFGYTDGAWCRAVTEQVNRLQHTSNLYYTEPCARLAEALCARTGMNKVFFSNSGAEANECAIKAARAYAAKNKGAEYFTVATLENSFHGRTLTTLAATGQAKFHEKFQPLTPGFISIPANDFDAFVRTAEKENLATVMIECVQGEGGVNVLEKDYVQKLAEYAAAH
ncbi:MAG: aminotransferase class III-fold pyridoxal phosphate-dependent enzyme, partial [Clostridia bacterium]|nr:aminotransferase class III-fold pyridoxal phosphate-dependent enzyme [Clostridia bacterium]